MGRVRNCGYEEDQRTLVGGLVFLFFIITNRSVVFYYSKVKGFALRDALLGDNNNYLRMQNDADLPPVGGLFRPSTSVAVEKIFGLYAAVYPGGFSVSLTILRRPLP